MALGRKKAKTPAGGGSSADRFRAAAATAEEATAALDALGVGAIGGAAVAGGGGAAGVGHHSNNGGNNTTQLERDVDDRETLARLYGKVHGTGEGADAIAALGEGTAVGGNDDDDDDEHGGNYEQYGYSGTDSDGDGDGDDNNAVVERDIRGNPIVITGGPASTHRGGGGGKLAGKAEHGRYGALRSKRRDANEKNKKHAPPPSPAATTMNKRNSNEREQVAGPGGSWDVQAKTPSSHQRFAKPKHEQEALVSNFLGHADTAQGKIAASTAPAPVAERPNTEKPPPKKPPVAPKDLDKFGFILNLDDATGKPVAKDELASSTPKVSNKRGGGGKTKSKKESKKESKASTKKDKKWDSMIKKWDKPRTKRRRKKGKVKSRARKGVPHELRGAAWARMGNVHAYMADPDERETYATLVKLSDSGIIGGHDNADEGAEEASAIGAAASRAGREAAANAQSATMDTIERDLDRTFPRHAMFYDGSDESESDDGDDGDESSSEEENVYDAGYGNDGTSSDGGPSVDVDDVRAPSNLPGAANGGSGANGEEPIVSGFGTAKKKYHVSRVLETLQGEGGCGHADLDDVEMSVMSDDGQQRSVAASSALALNPRAASASARNPKNGKTATSAAAGGSSHSSSHSRKLSRAERKINRKASERRNLINAQGGQASLRRVLRAYALRDPSVGYCQGMNFIAAMFLTFMPEEHAFWLLVNTMHEEPCTMRGLFGEGMAEAHKVLHVAEGLVRQFLPKLADHLEKENVHVTMYATQWLLTLYASSFPFELVTRVWDCFLAEGWKIVFRVMLAILDMASPVLLSLRFEEILGHFKELPDIIDGGATLEASLKIPLRRRHIAKLEEEWEARQQGGGGGR